MEALKGFEEVAGGMTDFRKELEEVQKYFGKLSLEFHQGEILSTI